LCRANKLLPSNKLAPKQGMLESGLWRARKMVGDCVLLSGLVWGPKWFARQTNIGARALAAGRWGELPAKSWTSKTTSAPPDWVSPGS